MTTITDHDVEHYASIDLYGVLHLMPEASAELIDKAYRLRMREVHPDLAGAARTEQAVLVNTAGEILREPTARARYDALRAARRARPGARQGTPSGQPRGREPGEERRRRELVQELAASEASQRELAKRVQWLAGQVRSRPGRVLRTEFEQPSKLPAPHLGTQSTPRTPAREPFVSSRLREWLIRESGETRPRGTTDCGGR